MARLHRGDVVLRQNFPAACALDEVAVWPHTHRTRVGSRCTVCRSLVPGSGVRRRMVMRRYWRIAVPLWALLALALSVAPASAALAVTAVTWNVTPAASYTIANNGAQPLVRFNDCLRADTTYTIPFAVTVEGTGSYSATL